jgi:hypothetical protein
MVRLAIELPLSQEILAQRNRLQKAGSSISFPKSSVNMRVLELCRGLFVIGY